MLNHYFFERIRKGQLKDKNVFLLIREKVVSLHREKQYTTRTFKHAHIHN